MVNASDYCKILEEVDIQFRLIRFAISNLPASRRYRFFKSLKLEEVRKTEANLEILQSMQKPSDMDFNEIRELLMKSTERATRRKFSKANQRFYEEFIEDGLNASELLIRVAHFETFMKEIHSAVLECKPSLLAKIQPNKTVRYEDLFEEGVSNQSFKAQEILREVSEVDRKSVKERAKYFETQLGLRWCDDDSLKFLKGILDERNKISHENPRHPINTSDLAKARIVMRKIPLECVSQARVIYKGYFK